MIPIRSNDMKETNNQNRSYFDYNHASVNKEDIETKSFRAQKTFSHHFEYEPKQQKHPISLSHVQAISKQTVSPKNKEIRISIKLEHFISTIFSMLEDYHLLKSVVTLCYLCLTEVLLNYLASIIYEQCCLVSLLHEYR